MFESRRHSPEERLSYFIATDTTSDTDSKCNPLLNKSTITYALQIRWRHNGAICVLI